MFISSLRRQFVFQIPAIIGAILVVPLLVMVYDIIYASKTDQMLLVNKEERLATIVHFLSTAITNRLENKFIMNDPEQKTIVLSEAFNRVAEPLAAKYKGVRLGLYVPATDKLFVQGFLHEYRKLTPEEKRLREQRIYREASSGIKAVLGSRQPFARIAGNPDDQFFEHLEPVFIDQEIVAVVWAEERLNPIFSVSRQFRLIIRYLTLASFLFGTIGILLVVNTFVRQVRQIKTGLERLEHDLSALLPELPGEMGQITQAINKMAISLAEKEKLEEQLRRSDRLATLGRLVTGLAHEIRNPVGIIKATVQVLEKEISDRPELTEYTTIIKQQVDRQNQIITELLEFGRPRPKNVQPLDLNKLIRAVVAFTEPLLEQNKIDLKLNLRPNIPEIEADGEKLKQVLVNLILNAIQAMPDGGRLRITTLSRNGTVLISVRDTGHGISEDDIKHIFDPFYTTKEGGGGLGLAIAHQIVEAHGGEIQVRSYPEKGTTFIIALPVTQKRKDLRYS